jgi:hypothetical protein
MEEIIYRSKNKIKDIILSALVIVGSALMLLKSVNDDSIIGVIIFSIFVIGGLMLLVRALKNKPKVSINKKGILNNTNGMGLIPWKYIEGFKITRIRNGQVLVILINDEDSLLKEMNPISRTLMKTNTRKLGSPVAIGSSEFNDDLNNVIIKLEDYKKGL